MNLDINEILIFKNKRKIDLIMQAEAAECGLACILMVANFFGHKIDLVTARRDFSVSLKGLTLNSMVSIAKKIEMTARPVRIDLDDVETLVCPVILHWDLTHFVVLESCKNGIFQILDPAKGRYSIKLEEMSHHFTGVALELIPNKNFKKVNRVTPAKLSSMWGRLSGVKRSLIQLLLISLVLQIFVLIGPLMNQFIIDEAVNKLDASILVPIALGLLLVGFFQNAMSYVRSKVMLYLTNSLNLQMTVNLYSHLVRLPAEYFEKRKIGDIVTRFGSLGPIQSLISDGVVSIILDSFLAIFALILALIYSYQLTLIAITFLLIDILISYAAFPYTKRKSEAILESSAKEQSTFLENIQAALTIKIFGQEDARESFWVNRKADLMNENIGLAKFNMNLGLGVGLIATIQSVMILYFGAKYVIDGVMSLGMLFAYQSYSSQFSGRISSLIDKFFAFKMLGMHLERLADIVHTESENDCSSHISLSKENIQGHISFKNVSFRYADSEPWILKNVNFTIHPGEMVTITGPSGSGKSTVLKLITGVLRPTEGEIEIDGLPLSKLDLASYRKLLGVVMQEDKLLSGTIEDNICFFGHERDYEYIKWCAKVSCLEHDILKNPMGYNTLVGDMGSTLSGGQKQRLLIARAFYKKPNILLMDEGTANLDLSLENMISEFIGSIRITRVMIAHRPKLAEVSDRVLYLDDLQLVELHKETV